MLLEKLNELDRILNSMIQVRTPDIIPLVREIIELAKLNPDIDVIIDGNKPLETVKMATPVEVDDEIKSVIPPVTLTPLEHVNDALLDKAREFLRKKKVPGVHFYKPENLLAKAREKGFNF